MIALQLTHKCMKFYKLCHNVLTISNHANKRGYAIWKKSCIFFFTHSVFLEQIVFYSFTTNCPVCQRSFCPIVDRDKSSWIETDKVFTVVPCHLIVTRKRERENHKEGKQEGQREGRKGRKNEGREEENNLKYL